MKITHKTLLFGAALILTGQGCSSGLFTGEAPIPPNGGLYVTENSGATWQQRALIPTVTGQPGSIAQVSVFSMKLDPSDKKAVYLGSAQNGLIYSYDQGRTWQQAPHVRSGNVYDLTIDPKDKCNITIAQENRILRSGDCNRTYTEVFKTADPSTTITSLETHPINSAQLLAGTSEGKILASQNSGSSWAVIHQFDGDILQIVFHPEQHNVVYALVDRNGIFKSADRGQTWINITPDEDIFKEADSVHSMVWDAKSGRLFVASDFGITVTTDDGQTWKALELISESSKAEITAMAINPSNVRQIIYATNQSGSVNLYASGDGGNTWKSIPAPTTRSISSIQFDPDAPHIIYLAGLAS